VNFLTTHEQEQSLLTPAMDRPPRAPSCADIAVGSRRCTDSRRRLVLSIVSVATGLSLALCTPIAKAAADTSKSAEKSHPRPSAPAARANAAAAQPPLPIAVTIDRLDPGPPVPREFLGLSFEAAALDQIAQYADRGDLV
jgi:hypothetical protein